MDKDMIRVQGKGRTIKEAKVKTGLDLFVPRIII